MPQDKKIRIIQMKKLIWIIASVLMIAAFIVQIFGLFSDAQSVTIAISYFICLFAAGAFLLVTRRRKQPAKQHKNIAFRFIISGSIGAALVEILFWAVEIMVGSNGVAAHPNIFIDLAVLMPWYISMITIFWFVNKKCGFSWQTTMLLGGIYELFADGIAGNLLMGNQITPEYIVMLPIFFGVFVFVYFPMLAMPVKYYNIKSEIDVPLPQYKRILYAMLPVLALIPYSLLFLIIFA